VSSALTLMMASLINTSRSIIDFWSELICTELIIIVIIKLKEAIMENKKRNIGMNEKPALKFTAILHHIKRYSPYRLNLLMS
jgi:hypothetical protein